MTPHDLSAAENLLSRWLDLFSVFQNWRTISKLVPADVGIVEYGHIFQQQNIRLLQPARDPGIHRRVSFHPSLPSRGPRAIGAR